MASDRYPSATTLGNKAIQFSIKNLLDSKMWSDGPTYLQEFPQDDISWSVTDSGKIRLQTNEEYKSIIVELTVEDFTALIKWSGDWESRQGTGIYAYNSFFSDMIDNGEAVRYTSATLIGDNSLQLHEEIAKKISSGNGTKQFPIEIKGNKLDEFSKTIVAIQKNSQDGEIYFKYHDDVFGFDGNKLSKLNSKKEVITEIPVMKKYFRKNFEKSIQVLDTYIEKGFGTKENPYVAKLEFYSDTEEMRASRKEYTSIMDELASQTGEPVYAQYRDGGAFTSG